MGFNYAAEKKKFETLWAGLRREYRAAGMSDAAIHSLLSFNPLNGLHSLPPYRPGRSSYLCRKVRLKK